MNFYSFPTIFLDPQYLKIEKSSFTHGIGSLLYSQNTNQVNEIHDENFDQNNKDTIPSELIDESKDKKLLIIRDCTFSSLTGSENLIKQTNEKATYYLTSCTFHNCHYNKGLQLIHSRAATCSHICFSNSYYQYNNKVDGIFIETYMPKNTFFKIYYSTIVGDGEELNSLSIIYLNGICSLKYQCMNVSNFQQKYQNEQIAAVKFISQSCLNMLMNTFYKCKNINRYIVYLNPQNGFTGYRHYISLCNFLNNNYENAINIDFQTGTHACVDGCVFYNPDEENHRSKIFRAGNNPNECSLIIENCIFDCNYEISGELSNLQLITKNNDEQSNPKTIEIAHFIITDICNGISNDDAFGCKNGTCPEDKGCGKDAFDFNKEQDVIYTEKYHPDVDTPTPSPTDYFSNSKIFSQTNYFSHSQQFSFSDQFSLSETLIVPKKTDPPNDGSKSNEDKKLKPGEIAGIAIAAVVAAAGIALLVFFLVKRHINSLPIEEDVETLDSNQTSTKNDNPIYDMKGSDDPFKEDFNS